MTTNETNKKYTYINKQGVLRVFTTTTTTGRHRYDKLYDKQMIFY